MDISYADIVARRVSFTVSEAVDLVLAAIEEQRGEPIADDQERVAQLAGLLRRLVLGEDEAPRGPVPGALLLLIARASGDMAVPAPSLAEFENLLARFRSPDPGEIAIRDIAELPEPTPAAPIAERSARLYIALAAAAALIIGIASGFAAGYGFATPRLPAPQVATVTSTDADVLPEAAAPPPAKNGVGDHFQRTVSPENDPRPHLRKAARLYVESLPSDARVTVDGHLVGTTPLMLSDIGAGAHVVRLERPGHQPWITSVRAAAGVTTRVAGSLQ
jgi:hypothetical protein